MAKFSYKGRTIKGSKSGYIIADSRRDAVVKLTGEGIKVITGLDAHSISDMARRYLKRKEI